MGLHIQSIKNDFTPSYKAGNGQFDLITGRKPKLKQF